METTDDKVEATSHRDHVTKKPDLVSDNLQEHGLTLRDVFRNHKPLLWWSFYWAMCAVSWGFDAQVNGNMISVDAFRRDFGYIFEGQPVLPASWQTAFNVISSAGQFFGGFICSYIADRIGRKKSLVCGLIIVTGGIFGEMFSTTKPAFLMSKLILGFGLGFYLTLGPLAASEIAPVVLRGISTAGINLGIAIGQLVSNSVIKGFGERTDHWAYRGPFAVQLLFCAFLTVFLPFAPETPWYLARRGERDLALKSLRSLYGDSIDVDAKLAALEATIEGELSASQVAREGDSALSRFTDCFRGTNRLRTLISIGVFICQHFVGIIFVLGYSTYFFKLAGLDTSRAFDLGVGVTACGVAGNALSWFVVNSYGRRPVFLTGMVALTALLFLIGIMDVVPTGAAKWVQASATVVYAFIYFATIGAMAFVVLGETSSTSLRAATTALATATQAVMGIIMNFAIPYMVNPDEGNLRGKVGFVFGGLALIATAWSFLYVPELKGRTFDEIDRMFQMRVPPRKMGSYVF